MTNKPQSGTQDRNDNRPNVRATALRVSASCDAGNIEAQSGFVSLQFPPIGDCGGHQSSVKPQRYDWDRPFNERTALRRVPPRRGPFLPSSSIATKRGQNRLSQNLNRSAGSPA